MACKDCKFLDVPLDAAGRRRVIKNRMYNCTVPTPVFPPIPASMEVKIHEHGMMCGDYGRGCPTFEALAKDGRR